MKKIVFVALALVAMATCRPDSKYSDKYDNVDIEELLDNRRLLIANVKCLMDVGKCTPEMEAFKGNLRESLETDCLKCTEYQKRAGRKLAYHVSQKEPELWSKLVAKYDPEGKYHEKYEQEFIE